MKVISRNSEASRNYEIKKTYECGVELKGSEVKSIRNNGLNLKNAYVNFRDGQAYVIGSHISEYKFSNIFNHDPDRTRRLLLTKLEIFKLQHTIAVEKWQCFVTQAYFKGGLIKFEIGVGPSKNKADKRQDIKEKDLKRETAKAVKNFNAH